MNQETLDDIIRNYGSLEAYNEEQRRCAVATIDGAMKNNPFTKRFKIYNAFPIEARKVKQPRKFFWLKFFTPKLKRVE